MVFWSIQSSRLEIIVVFPGNCVDLWTVLLYDNIIITIIIIMISNTRVYRNKSRLFHFPRGIRGRHGTSVESPAAVFTREEYIIIMRTYKTNGGVGRWPLRGLSPTGTTICFKEPSR